jgi:hypothetical protein
MLKQAAVLRQQERMMSFSAPTGTIALTNDFDECKRLLSNADYVRAQIGYNATGSPYDAVAACFSPPISDPLLGTASGRIYRGYGQGGWSHVKIGPDPTVFLHGRRSAAGKERLVHVTALFYSDALPATEGRQFVTAGWNEYRELQRDQGIDDPEYVGLWKLQFIARVVTPATWRPNSMWRVPFILRSTDYWLPSRLAPPDDHYASSHLETLPTRVFVAAPDDKDESRFIIDYQLDGSPGQLRGSLNGDDTVTFEVLSGPLRNRQ